MRALGPVLAAALALTACGGGKDEGGDTGFVDGTGTGGGAGTGGGGGGTGGGGTGGGGTGGAGTGGAGTGGTCGTGTGGTATGGGTGTGTGTGSTTVDPPVDDGAPWFCTDHEPEVTGGPGDYRATSGRYDLLLAVDDAATAEDLARFADAAYDAMADWFGAEPAPASFPLPVQLYPDVDSWAADISADGSEPPWGAGGYYWPPSEKAYITPQPTVYYEYTLVLHEMLHQFHFLARTGNDNRPYWYVEGLAEMLSRHDWDGRCLRLGRIPLVSQEDAWADALDELGGVPPDVAGIVDQSWVPSRPVAMTLFHHLHTDHTDAFAAWRAETDAGADDPLGRFETLIGDPDVVGRDLVDALPTRQEPFVPVFLEWWHRSPERVDALVFDPVYSTARLKGSAPPTFATTVRWDESGYVGLLAGYGASSNDQVGLLVSASGEVSAFDITGGVVLWTTEEYVSPPGSRVDLSLTHDGGEAAFGVNGEVVRIPIGHPPAAGLVVYDTTATFDGIGW